MKPAPLDDEHFRAPDCASSLLSRQSGARLITRAGFRVLDIHYLTHLARAGWWPVDFDARLERPAGAQPPDVFR